MGGLLSRCWNVHDREFPLLPAIGGGAGETTTTLRPQRNAGRQRSGSNRRDRGHPKTFSDLKAPERPMARRLTRGAGRRAAGGGRRRTGGGPLPKSIRRGAVPFSLRSNSGIHCLNRKARILLPSSSPPREGHQQWYENRRNDEPSWNDNPNRVLHLLTAPVVCDEAEPVQVGRGRPSRAPIFVRAGWVHVVETPHSTCLSGNPQMGVESAIS